MNSDKPIAYLGFCYDNNALDKRFKIHCGVKKRFILEVSGVWLIGLAANLFITGRNDDLCVEFASQIIIIFTKRIMHLSNTTLTIW